MSPWWTTLTMGPLLILARGQHMRFSSILEDLYRRATELLRIHIVLAGGNDGEDTTGYLPDSPLVTVVGYSDMYFCKSD